MKKLTLIIAVIFSASIASAQSGDRTTGPKFKNMKASERVTTVGVSGINKEVVKGPEAKNNKSYASEITTEVVASTDRVGLKGPKFKNSRP